jgi:hypothetical protein
MVERRLQGKALPKTCGLGIGQAVKLEQPLLVLHVLGEDQLLAGGGVMVQNHCDPFEVFDIC